MFPASAMPCGKIHSPANRPVAAHDFRAEPDRGHHATSLTPSMAPAVGVLYPQHFRVSPLLRNERQRRTVLEVSNCRRGGARKCVSKDRLDLPAVIRKLRLLARPTVASDAHAPEAAFDTGTFTINRTGGTESALTVTYPVGGSLVNGTDCERLAGSATFTADERSSAEFAQPIGNIHSVAQPHGAGTCGPFSLGGSASNGIDYQSLPPR